MGKWAKGKFQLKNPQKYVGNKIPTYRSSWELKFMQMCDNNPNILQWASEPIRIPYRHPFTGKNTTYVPDFIVVYRNRSGKQIAELIEIKPKAQSAIIEGKRTSAKGRAVIALNEAKWASARAYCRSTGLIFRVVTEADIFVNGSR